jgi:hypothetical protein
MVTRLHWAKLILGIAALCVALSTYAFAGSRGSAGRSGGSGGADSGSRHQAGDRSASRDYAQQDNRDDFTRSRDAEDSADGSDARESERSSSGQAEANNSERGERSGFFNRRGDEKVVETHQEKNKTGERESSEHRSEKSEVAKKFDSSLLFADVAGGQQSGPTHNPGIDHMSQQGRENSQFGRTTAQNAIDQHSGNAPAGHREDLRRDERHPRDGSRREHGREHGGHHPRLSDQQVEVAKNILSENFTDKQLETLKETLRSGELTDREKRNLRQIFGDKLSDQEEQLVVEYLQQLMRDQPRHG